jgi:ABC-type oligopeptide transport system ATPase subunit
LSSAKEKLSLLPALDEVMVAINDGDALGVVGDDVSWEELD